MDNETVKNSEKRNQSIKRIKRKIVPSILAGFSLPVTLFLYGPFDLFAQNRAEFLFTLYDFLIPCLILTFICGTVLSVISLILRKTVYRVYTAILFWASVMSFIQGSYLNFGYTALTGDGVTESAPFGLVFGNALIWIATLALTVICVLKFKPFKKNLKTIVSFGLALVLFMECVGTVTVSFKDDVFANHQDVLDQDSDSIGAKMLTTENLTTLSENRNVVVFVVDRFDASYYRKIVAESPELLSELDGFTYYSDHISLYPRTFPAIAYMLTGEEKSPNVSRLDYFSNAYKNADNLKHLNDNGYGINIYTADYYAYDNASVMAEYTQNVTSYTSMKITDKAELVGSMIAFSAYRYFPFFLKGTVDFISTSSFSSLVEFSFDSDQEKYSTDNKKVHEQLTAEDFTLTDEVGRYTFLHIDGCHGPSKYDANFNEVAGKNSKTLDMAAQSFAIINRYIREMKRLAVYDDATIIITGDHAAAISDSKPVEGARVTTLLLKPSGATSNVITENTAPTCQEDIWKTIFACEGLDIPKNCGGEDLLTVSETAERTRRYVFHRMNGETAEEIEYKIIGNANDFSNWSIVSRKDIPRIYK